MEKIVWLLSFVPARICVFLLGGANIYLIDKLISAGIFQNSIFYNTKFDCYLAGFLSLLCAIFAFIGGNIGLKYIEIYRSRSWHFRSSKFNDYNGRIKNYFYWAAKFACFPIIIFFIILLTWCFINMPVNNV